MCGAGWGGGICCFIAGGGELVIFVIFVDLGCIAATAGESLSVLDNVIILYAGMSSVPRLVMNIINV